MSYSKYIPSNERPVISALIRSLMDCGCRLTVNDGEDDLVVKSSSVNAVRSELGGTGEDWIIVYDEHDTRLGYFYLIYNNGSDGDPMVVISDYSYTADSQEFMDSVWDTLNKKYG